MKKIQETIKQTKVEQTVKQTKVEECRKSVLILKKHGVISTEEITNIRERINFLNREQRAMVRSEVLEMTRRGQILKHSILIMQKRLPFLEHDTGSIVRFLRYKTTQKELIEILLGSRQVKYRFTGRRYFFWVTG